MTRIATITLYIDVEQFTQDAEQPLTEELLTELGKQVSNDATGIYGYSSWQVGWAEFREDGFVTREFIEVGDNDNEEQ
jgi:hypothetical protein